VTDLEETGPRYSVLALWAGKEYENSIRSGDKKKYFSTAIDDVVSEFKLPSYVKGNISNFSTDRYIYYRRHKELDKEKASVETMIDTYHYLLEIKNNYGLLENGVPFRDYWREK